EVVARELLRGVALTPLAEALDDLAEFLARCSQAILAPAAARERRADDDTGVLQLAKPLAQQGAGDQRHAALDLAKPARAREQLAKDQRRPALGEDLGSDRDGTELTIAFHRLRL